jgi:hydrogenase maturation protease
MKQTETGQISMQLPRCAHCSNEIDGVALIALGDASLRDGTVAVAVCKALPRTTVEGVCRFDVDSSIGLAECLQRHKAAIIVDATRNGDPPGTVSLLDLSGMNEHEGQIDLRPCYAISLPHELRLAKTTSGLPRRIIFVGIEVANSRDQLKLNPELSSQLPHLVNSLSRLVTTVVEAVKRYQ